MESLVVGRIGYERHQHLCDAVQAPRSFKAMSHVFRDLKSKMAREIVSVVDAHVRE